MHQISTILIADAIGIAIHTISESVNRINIELQKFLPTI